MGSRFIASRMRWSMNQADFGVSIRPSGFVKSRIAGFAWHEDVIQLPDLATEIARNDFATPSVHSRREPRGAVSAGVTPDMTAIWAARPRGVRPLAMAGLNLERLVLSAVTGRPSEGRVLGPDDRSIQRLRSLRVVGGADLRRGAEEGAPRSGPSRRHPTSTTKDEPRRPNDAHAETLTRRYSLSSNLIEIILNCGAARGRGDQG
jgi:hypothetical protein